MASWQEGLLQIHGKQAQVEKAREAIQSVDISKNKATVMSEIQNIIDDKKLKASIYYDGLRIYPFLSLKKEFEKMIKTDSIEKMTDAMYNLLYLSFDIAHYNKHGYIDYYGGKFSILWKETLSYEMHKLLEHPYPRRNDSLVSLSNFVVSCMDGGKEVVVTEKGIQEPSLASSSFFSEENVLFSLPTTTDIPMSSKEIEERYNQYQKCVKHL